MDNAALQIKPRDEELLTAFGSSGKEKNTSLQKSSYESPDLAYILLQLSIKNKKYAFRLEIPEMTASNFRNLKGED
ncbi:MAG: hypothetical protein HYV28_05275 [Ignavibacteriales bacterium]|nr:hypothetical protein [Ignavibacteriales bacterium]